MTLEMKTNIEQEKCGTCIVRLQMYETILAIISAFRLSNILQKKQTKTVKRQKVVFQNECRGEVARNETYAITLGISESKLVIVF